MYFALKGSPGSRIVSAISPFFAAIWAVGVLFTVLIKYLYFADNLPLIKEDRSEGVECTDDMIALMREGQIPKPADVSGAPRCSMSREKNEINIYGTPYIKEHFNIGKSKDKGQGVQYQNLWGRQRNRNYHPDRRPKEVEEPKVRYVEYDPSDDETFDIIEPLC